MHGDGAGTKHPVEQTNMQAFFLAKQFVRLKRKRLFFTHFSNLQVGNFFAENEEYIEVKQTHLFNKNAKIYIY